MLSPGGSPEFVGKFRKAFYEEDRLALQILVDFGVDASKIMNDILRKNFPLEPDILNIIFGSPKINLNQNYYRGEYPLVLAAIFLDKPEIWSVLQKNDNVNWKYVDKKGRNLAFWSVCCRTANIGKFLRVCQIKNIDMDKADKNGNRAINIAVIHKKFEIVKYLVDECKVDVNAGNQTGITIGHEMCERSCNKMLEYLLKKGIKLDIPNDAGETALDYARMYYSQPIVDVLEKFNLWTTE